MQNPEWIALFRRFPSELHSQLMLVLTNRTEIAVEAICRLEPTFIAVRGRMGGTTESGLLFMLPYDQLSGVYSSRELKESEVQAILSAASDAQREAAVGENLDKPSPSANGASKMVVPSFGRAPESTSVARNNLLERLRAARAAATPPGK